MAEKKEKYGFFHLINKSR